MINELGLFDFLLISKITFNLKKLYAFPKIKIDNCITFALREFLI